MFSNCCTPQSLNINKNDLNQNQIALLWLRHRDIVFNFVFKFIKDQFISEDICHDVFLKFHHYTNSGNEINNVRSFLFKTAHNKVIDHFRKEKAKKLVDTRSMSAHDHDKADQYQELSIYIRPLLKCLPEIYATPLELDLNGVKQKDIAAHLQLELSATKSRIQRSRRMIKELLFECLRLEISNNGKILSGEAKDDCMILQDFHKNANSNFFASF
ncbi:sigma-70 family RNA polymerase sigma factor [Mucilaginibacter sp. McL0603]|uniref:sigma-70 family RNA polymerase sigma factor n=1 Tax=Mucilaginibacter sp. McL0603 TaxID=3415670 RepID=UPI003CF5EE21